VENIPATAGASQPCDSRVGPSQSLVVAEPSFQRVRMVSSSGTINTIAVVDAELEPAALVNLVITLTEVKALVLAEAGVATDGHRATGTSTDAVVVAATGRGRALRFGGPISDAGWVVARAARTALTDGVRQWLEDRA